MRYFAARLTDSHSPARARQSLAIGIALAAAAVAAMFVAAVLTGPFALS